MNSRIPSHFQLGAQKMLFREIHKRYAATNYGEKLKTNVRFLPYKPKHIANEYWEELLGPDVNNFKHLWHTFSLMRNLLATNVRLTLSDRDKFQSLEDFSSSEQQLLLLTAVTHDWAEAIIGDIPYPIKTETDTKREMIALRKLIHEILGEGNKTKEWDEVADHIETILTDTGSKLGKAFNAIERLGYTRVSIRAWQQSKNTNGELRRELKRMGMRIVPHHIPALIRYAENYPSIAFQLTRNSKTISEIVKATVGNPTFHNEDWFLAGQAAWERRKTS